MRNLILIVMMLTSIYLPFIAQENKSVRSKSQDKKDLILKEKTKQKELTRQDFTDIENLPNLFAILVGVNKYEDENIRALKYAVADVKGLHEVLNDRNRVPYKKSYIHLLTDDSAKKPTRINVYKSLGIVRKMAESDDTILFYFSGHGIEEDGESYLLPSDTDINALTYSAILLKNVHKELSKSKAKRQVIILDSCHSGGVRRDKGVRTSKKFTQSVEEIMASAEGRVVLASSDVDESSYEFSDKDHGVYTYYLIEALKGKSDRDNNGFVAVQEAHQYVFENVRSWAFNKGVSQTPRIDVNMSGSIVFTVNPETERVSYITQQYEPETIIADFDGAEMIQIPAGKFVMGSKVTRGNSDEHPRHEVYLDAFYIDLHEVTNAQYAMFLEATGYPNKPKYWNDKRFNTPEQPVVGVSWYDANEYAKWVGRRLPTEAEWEKAVRGVDRRTYPWGNEWNEELIPQSNAAVSVESESLDESPYKVRGMASNVAEWVADYYKEDYYSSNAGIEWTNPLGPKLSGFIKVKVIRGASWKDINRDTARCARRNRNMPNLKFNNIGFRLAKSE